MIRAIFASILESIQEIKKHKAERFK